MRPTGFIAALNEIERLLEGDGYEISVRLPDGSVVTGAVRPIPGIESTIAVVGANDVIYVDVESITSFWREKT